MAGGEGRGDFKPPKQSGPPRPEKFSVRPWSHHLLHPPLPRPEGPHLLPRWHSIICFSPYNTYGPKVRGINSQATFSGMGERKYKGIMQSIILLGKLGADVL